jgi:hypothetical protein
VAGFAAMLLTAALGTAMGLNNTAAFMASCVAFVAVSKSMESHLARRRREAAARLPGSGREAPPSALDTDQSERDARG